MQEEWDCYFPTGYDSEIKASTRSNERSGEAHRHLVHPVGSGSTNISPSPPPPPKRRGGGGATQTQGDGGGDIPNTMVYHPSYDKTRWRVLMDEAGTMREVIKRASGVGLNLPPSPND